MKRRVAVWLAVAVATLGLTACYGAGNSNVSAEGHGLPTMTLDFPSTAPAGSTQKLVIAVSNPGPGDMDSVFVAFTNVGVAGTGVGTPIVPVSTNRKNPAVADVQPSPDAVSADGVVYRFGPLEEGAGERIEFSLVVPSTQGPAANSVQVYDGSEPDRAVGMRLSTTVEG